MIQFIVGLFIGSIAGFTLCALFTVSAIKKEKDNGNSRTETGDTDAKRK